MITDRYESDARTTDVTADASPAGRTATADDPASTTKTTQDADDGTDPGRPAPTDHPIHPLLGKRWSPRAMAPHPVSRDSLRSLLEAARWAPSSYNEQPWRFVVGTPEEPDFRERLRTLLTEGNAWAREAPVLILSAYLPESSRTGDTNRMAFRDLGAAEENLVLQAYDLGLVAHQMAGFDAGAARRLLPDGMEPGTMTAIAHPASPDSLPDKLAVRERRPRRRRPLRELVSIGSASGFPGGEGD